MNLCKMSITWKHSPLTASVWRYIELYLKITLKSLSAMFKNLWVPFQHFLGRKLWCSNLFLELEIQIILHTKTKTFLYSHNITELFIGYPLASMETYEIVSLQQEFVFTKMFLVCCKVNDKTTYFLVNFFKFRVSFFEHGPPSIHKYLDAEYLKYQKCSHW